MFLFVEALVRVWTGVKPVMLICTRAESLMSVLLPIYIVLRYGIVVLRNQENRVVYLVVQLIHLDVRKITFLFSLNTKPSQKVRSVREPRYFPQRDSNAFVFNR